MFTRNIRLFILGQFISGFGMSFWSLLFNLYLHELGLSKDKIGVILAVANLATALLALPAGIFVSRHNQKTTLIVSQLLYSVLAGLAVCSVGTSLLTYVFLAFSFATFLRIVAGPFIMANTTSVERTYVFSVHFITTLIGGIAGNFFAGNLQQVFRHFGLTAAFGYQIAIIAGVALAGISILPYFFMKTDKEDADVRLNKHFHFKEIRNWNWDLFIRALIPSSLVSIGAGIIIQFMNLYFRDTFSLPDSAIGTYMSIQSLAMALGSIIVPMLAEKYGKVTTIVGSQLFSIPFMLVLAFTGDIHIAFAAFILRAAFMNMASPVSNTLLLELCTREEQPIINALLVTASGIAYSVSALAFGRFLNGNYTQSFVIAVILYSLSAILYYWFFRDFELSEARKPSVASVELLRNATQTPP